MSKEQSVRTIHSSSYNLEKDFKFQFKDFEDFYNKFINDSVYQLSRVKFPIKGVYADYDGEKQWTKETWPFMSWDLRGELNSPNDSISIKQSEINFFFGSYCRECGFSFEMSFEKLDHEWFLTYRQENNF